MLVLMLGIGSIVGVQVGQKLGEQIDSSGLKALLAILLFVTATFFGSLMGVFMRLAQSDINVFTASFLRFGIGFVIILPYLFYSKFNLLKFKIVAMRLPKKRDKKI